MAKLPTVRYIWTAEDQRIAGGDTAGSVQGAYVTPYGIPAAGIPKCARFTPGAEVEVDLGRSGWGEPWRATRFCHGKPLYEWHKPGEIPGAVTTLAELCKYLRERDPIAYPDAIYGDKKLADLTGPDNPAKMLFDYWQNSRYRYGTVKEGFDWGTYARDPGSIKVRRDGGAIEYVLRKIVPLPRAAAAPGAQKRLIDEPSLLVEHYITEVADSAANIRMLLKTSETVMRERYQIIYQLQALRAIAQASFTTPQGGAPSQGAEVVRLVDAILPKANKLLVTQPIRSGSTEQRLMELFNSRREFTMDAVAELRAEERRLRNLLLGSSAHANTLKNWAVTCHPRLLQGQPAIVQLLDRLTAVLADAHYALGECGTHGHDDSIQALLSRVQDGHAQTPDNIGGDSPTEVVLSLVGKGTSIATTVVGNLAGPPSLSIAMLQVSSLLKFPRLVKDAHGALSKIQVDFTQLSSWRGPHPELLDLEYGVQVLNRKLDELTGHVLSHLPDGDLKDDLRCAIIAQDQKALAEIKDAYGEAMAGSAQNTVAWKGAMVLLGLLSVVLSIRDAHNAQDKHFALMAIDFTSQASGVLSVSLGTYETLMTALGRLEPAADALLKFGNAIGLVTSITGVLSGAAGYLDACDKADGLGAVSAMLGVLGSTGMAIVAAYALAGTAMPALAAISLACLLASGAVSVAQVIESLDNKATKTNRACLSLIRAIRASALGKFMEQSDGIILFGMEDLERLAKDGLLPNAKNDYWIVSNLAKAGLSRGLIQEVVNSTALASTPLGPGPAVAAF
ncbi:hypothetical protein [Sorangium sp. So ce131]|uniref:hypothetical protein n=1 Tax=Sorangium sp. So ce131 TaxID=3133282 RepID=UPI003F5D9110